MEKSFYARWNMPILAAVLFLLPFAVVGAYIAKNSNKNQVKDWLPPELPANRDYREFRQRFQGDEFILASWEGCTLDDQRLKMMALKLDPATGDPEVTQYFKEVSTGPRAIHQMVRGADNEDEATAEGKDLPLEATQPGPWRLSEDPDLRDQQLDAMEDLTGWLIGPPQGETDPNKRLTCLVLKLSEHGRAEMRKTVPMVAEVASQCGIPPSDLHMGGPPVDNVAIDNAGEERLTLLFGLSILIGVAVSWYSLRSFRLVALVVFAGVYSMFLSLALIAFTGQSVNAIVLTMPTLVYVATTSGAIHLANYYRDSIRAGTPADRAPGDAIAHAWLPLSLATGTTAVGLLTLCYSNLVPIQMFGLYSAIGVVVSLLLLFLFIPSVLQLWPSRVAAQSAGTKDDDPEVALGKSYWWSIGHFIAQRHALVAPACLALMAIAGFGMAYATTSVQLMKLFSPGARILEDYAWLESKLGPLVPMEIIVSMEKKSDLINTEEDELNFVDRLELVRTLQREIQEIEEVGATMSAATFVPLDSYSGRRRIGFGVNPRDVLNRRLLDESNYGELLAGDYLREEQDPATGKTLQHFRISARVSATRDVDYAAFREELKASIEPVLADYSGAGINVNYTGVMPLIYDAQHSLLNDLILGFFTDFALIVIVMMIACRDWSAGLVLLVPSAFPAVVIFGLLGWSGIPIDIGTVMAPAVALGVTVDDVVHFMLWFRRGIASGMNRVDAVMLAYKGCARAMYQSWGVIGIGLSVYAFSPFAPTQKFGYLMVSLLTAALIGNLLLLPAILAGPLGAVFAWGVRRRTAKSQTGVESRARQRAAAMSAHRPDLVPEPHMKHESARRSVEAH